MITINKIIFSIWSILWSHSPQDSNQSKSNNSKKDPAEGVTFLSQMACSVILYNLVSTSPGELTQVQKMVLVVVQIPPYSAKR